MRFSNILSGLLSLAAIAAPLVSAQGAETNENIIFKPAANDVWVAGTPFDIEWTVTAQSGAGTVSIILLKGLQTNLQVVETIAPGVANNGRFQWTPPITLEGLQTMPADQIYGFKIVTDITGNFGWSPPFKLSSPQSTFGGAVTTGTTGVSSTATAASTASTATTDTSISTSTEVSTTASVTSISTSASSVSTSAPSTSASETESSTVSSSTAVSTSAASTSAASTSSESTTSSTSPTAALSTETESSTSTPESAPSGGSKISNIAIAGIAVSAVAAIAIGILAFFLVRRRKRSQRHRLVDNNGPATGKYENDFIMMERKARNRSSSFGFNTTRSGDSGALAGRNDPYTTLDDGHSAPPSRDNRDSWGRLENVRF